MTLTRNPKEREVLSDKSVAVISYGSVGSAIADILVRSGRGKVVLIDPETVSHKNLARHMLSLKDLARPKVAAMRERLLDINTGCLIESRQEAFRDAEADVVVSCAGSYKCERLVNNASLREDIPAVYVGCRGATRIPGQEGLWANILVVAGVAFQVTLELFELRETIDYEHALWLVNISDYKSNLQPLAVTFGTVRKGCAVCDESNLSELSLET